MFFDNSAKYHEESSVSQFSLFSTVSRLWT
jgi:hypothetical protein